MRNTTQPHLRILLQSFAFAAAFSSSAWAQVQQGLPTQIKPDYRFSNPDPRDAKTSNGKSVETDSLGRPIKSMNDPKRGDKASSNKNDPKDFKKNNDRTKKDFGPKDDFSSGVRCFNCGIIVSVTESRKKAKPVWMSTTDPNDATSSEQAAKNAEKNVERNVERNPDRAETKSSDQFQKSSSSPVKLNGTLARPNSEFTLQRKLGFETVIKMEDGTMKTVVTALQPAYNIGAKVRVIGNSLSPR
jgi:hypothetical protein